MIGGIASPPARIDTAGMTRLLPLAMVLIAASCLPARAADSPECRNGSFPAQQAAFGLAKIVGAPRTYLRSDGSPCPAETTQCRGHVYVIPGDTVLTGATSGDYVCAYFDTKGGGSAGYVRRDEIQPLPIPAAPALSEWSGTWRQFDDRIVLTAKGNELAATGEAYWPSANPSPKLRPGGPNTGDFDGMATPKGNGIVFGGDNQDECRVTLTLLAPFLLAADNHNCGGMNVSFTGVYRKR